MPKEREVTHTGLTVNARKYDHEENPLDGAGIYEFYVELDGVPVVIGSRKAGTIDVRRKALAEAKARTTAPQPPTPPSTSG